MAICPKCDTKYTSSKCPNCYGKINEYFDTQSKNRERINQKFNKNEYVKIDKNTILVIIAIATVIIALIMIKQQYEDYRAEQTVKQLLYGTTNDNKIESINNKMTEQTNEILKQMDETNKNLLKEMHIQK